MSILAWALCVLLASAASRPADVAGIMARVAANQQSAHDARLNYVYRQEQTIRMRRGNGKLAREQRAEYVVTPGKKAVEKQLAKFEGKYQFKGKYVPYDHPEYRYQDLDIDGDL